MLDPGLRLRPDAEIEEMMQTLGVAMLCVQPTPDDRPTMKDVAAMLKEIRLEREESSKDAMNVKGSHVGDGDKRGNGGASSAMQSLYLQSNSSSFSASSLLNSASSISKLGFNNKP